MIERVEAGHASLPAVKVDKDFKDGVDKEEEVCKLNNVWYSSEILFLLYW